MTQRLKQRGSLVDIGDRVARHVRRYLRFAIQWLPFGLCVKRWLLLLAVGVAVLSLGFSFLLRELYPLPRIFYYLTLQFIPRIVRAGLFALIGIGAVVAGVVGLNRSLLSPFVDANPETLAQTIKRYRQRERGPRVVAIGGGHGLSTLLRGLKEHTLNITAIVTVADDGGSSGRLRSELGVLPPGDFRNCIAALADDEALTTHLFQYRFGAGSGLNGHSFGNLFITAMAGVTGSFERAILESSRVLAVRGQVLPSTLQNVTLTADLVQRNPSEPSGEKREQAEARLNRVTGESRIPAAEGTIQRVYLDPSDAPAYPGAVHALLNADMIVVGPGSLYTSVLPNLLVPAVADALAATAACKVYVCNVATQRGETEGYTVGDHVTALARHVGSALCPVVLANANLLSDRSSEGPMENQPGVEMVKPEVPPERDYRLVTADLVDPEQPWRHDSQRLARALMHQLEQHIAQR